MTDFIKYITELFKNFSPVNQVFLIVIFGGFIFVGYHFVKNEAFRKSLIKLITLMFSGFKNKKISLLQHELFYKTSLYTQLIENVKFQNETKTKLFRILLKEKAKSVITLTKDWVKKIDIRDITDVELYEKMSQLIIDIIADYEKNIKLNYEQLIGQEWCRIYNVIYESGNGFKALYHDNVNFIYRNIDRIAYTKAFSTKQKIYSFLTQLDVTTEIAITDCEKSFALLNGTLEKIIIKNNNT
jgi:hypothetical protein